MPTDPDDFLDGAGAPTAKFPTIGTVVKGTVLGKAVSQQRDFKTGLPKTYDDGNPMEQLVLTLQTDLRDPAKPDDDGQRRVFAKGGMLKAIRAAVKAKSPTGKLELGATIAVQYTGDGTAEGNLNPPKLFVADYAPPAVTADAAVASLI
jgi:hypothetical protein